jgi:hypothetical protein
MPTAAPTFMPSSGPSVHSSALPSIAPTDVPPKSVSETPSKSPTDTPTKFPTETPTNFPSETPFQFPSEFPSEKPSPDPICTTVTSDFEGGDEDWTTADDALGPYWNTAGYIFATDVQNGRNLKWNFRAPDKFHGNFSGAYGRLFSFQLRQSIGANDGNDNHRDVTFLGNGQKIWYNTDVNPGTTGWTDYSIVIDVHANGWMYYDTNNDASERQIREVLSDISDVYIRGEYQLGEDVGSLDNVKLECGP